MARSFIAQVGVGLDHRVVCQTVYITPGPPWENGYVESFNARLWDES